MANGTDVNGWGVAFLFAQMLGVCGRRGWEAIIAKFTAHCTNNDACCDALRGKLDDHVPMKLEWRPSPHTQEGSLAGARAYRTVAHQNEDAVTENDRDDGDMTTVSSDNAHLHDRTP